MSKRSMSKRSVLKRFERNGRGRSCRAIALPGQLSFIVNDPPPEGGGYGNGLKVLFRLKPAGWFPHQAGFKK